MSAGLSQTGEFDLQPSPRILPMLGEINLDQWRCIAELIDNGVDGFLHAARSGAAILQPEVIVTLPTAAAANARVQVRDNGPGMSAETLENAVRAGWTGNNPMDNLGLFGMGFNIATARLGNKTRVWTTREGDTEWHGVEIDFDELRRHRSFKTPHLTRPKGDPAEHGTEVTIERLKPDQLEQIAKSATQTRIREQLARSYAAMLRPGGMPLHFSLDFNGRRVPGRAHCVWSEDRFVDLPNMGEVRAVIPINAVLSDRLYCVSCMQWLPAGETSCTSPDCEVVPRQRRVHGWIGLQRHVHETEFGIDLIRNGRKIEIGVKELFEYAIDGGPSEREYPLDDPRNRGRIVGEIHLDHCRVHYDKTRFERSDPAWDDMVQIVRGEGPLQPEKARSAGFGPNVAPLYKLFQAFRRSQPRQRGGGGWARLLVVRDNDRALEMAKSFHDGAPDYQDDSKWWELVQAEDLNDLRGEGRARQGGGTTVPPGFLDPEPADPPPPPPPQQTGTQPAPLPPAPSLPREPAPELSRSYHLPANLRALPVDAFALRAGDPDLAADPWKLALLNAATRTYAFLFDPEHQVFRSSTFQPKDALLVELARHTIEMTRTNPTPPTLASALAELRANFATEDDLDPRTLVQEAGQALTDLARSVRAHVDEETSAVLFNEFEPETQQAIFRRMAARGVTKPAALVADGGFLEFVEKPGLRRFFESHPELFLDARYWDDPYSTIDFGDGATTDLARRRVVERYSSLIGDAVWISEQEPAGLVRASREEVVRAALSLRLLRPDVEPS